MSSEWRHTNLGDICSAQRGSIQTGPFGSQLHTSDYKEFGVPVVMPTNIGDGGIVEDGIARIDQSDVERLTQHKLRIDDIVFSRRGDVTKNALIREHEVGWLCGTGCLKVRLGDQSIANAKFISYCLRQPETKDWLVRHAVGATMPNLNTAILSAVPVHLPPLQAQLDIAELLGTLDDRITLLRETNATLEAIAQALFKSWFVDFDPVRAKQQGREPEGMDEATATLFPDSFEESELGRVPKGWGVGSILDIASLLSGGTPKTDRPEYWGGGIPWASAKDVSQSKGSVLIATERSITLQGLNESSTRMIPALATAIVARGATTGRMVLLGEDMAMNQTCYALSSKIDTPLALHCLLRREVDTLVNAAHGSVFDTITTNTFAQSKILQPSQPVLQHFEEIVSPLFEKIVEGTKTLSTLATLRDTLLPRLISGQLHLPEAESLLEEAAA